MCNFLSFISNGQKQIFYFNAIQRQGISEFNNFDSHDRIAEYYLCRKPQTDNCNKYEYNIFGELVVSQINVKDDSFYAEKWINNFKHSNEYIDLLLWKIKGSGKCFDVLKTKILKIKELEKQVQIQENIIKINKETILNLEEKLNKTICCLKHKNILLNN